MGGPEEFELLDPCTEQQEDELPEQEDEEDESGDGQSVVGRRNRIHCSYFKNSISVKHQRNGNGVKQAEHIPVTLLLKARVYVQADLPSCQAVEQLRQDIEHTPQGDDGDESENHQQYVVGGIVAP